MRLHQTGSAGGGGVERGSKAPCGERKLPESGHLLAHFRCPQLFARFEERKLKIFYWEGGAELSKQCSGSPARVSAWDTGEGASWVHICCRPGGHRSQGIGPFYILSMHPRSLNYLPNPKTLFFTLRNITLRYQPLLQGQSESFP